MIKTIVKKAYAALPFKKQLFSLLKKIYSPAEHIYKHLHFKGTFIIRLNEKSFFQLNHYGYQIENEIFWKGLYGGWEKTSLSLWIQLCKTSNVIIDIGANTGIYSLSAKCCNPQSKVYAFEPVQRVYDKLIKNIRLNNYDITSIPKAVSNNDGVATIYDTLSEHILSVTVNKNLNSPDISVVPVEVPTVKLSTIIENYSILHIDLIKIDVETHEVEVLHGMGKYLNKMRPTFIIEVINDDVAMGVQNLLEDKNYLYFNIDENKGIRQTDKINKSDYYNYLICQPSIAKNLGLQ